MQQAVLPTVKQIISKELKGLGYYKILVRNELSNSLDIVADGNYRSIFLQVKVTPNVKRLPFSKVEITGIKKQALLVNKEPWIAVIKVGTDGELIENIEWKDLSK